MPHQLAMALMLGPGALTRVLEGWAETLRGSRRVLQTWAGLWFGLKPLLAESECRACLFCLNVGFSPL